jgi:purine-binding chemotaxis protein CheW
MTTTVTHTKAEQETSLLSFKLGDEFFAIEVTRIMKIVEVPRITKIPKAPVFLKGVINHGGMVLPIVDLHNKFDLDPIEFTVNTCILILNIRLQNESIVLGALVDAVLEVVEMKEEEVQDPPTMGKQYNADFIRGMIRQKDQFMMLLEVDSVFSAEDLDQISEIKDKQDIAQQ